MFPSFLYLHSGVLFSSLFCFKITFSAVYYKVYLDMKLASFGQFFINWEMLIYIISIYQVSA